MTEDPRTTTFQVRPGGSRQVERHPETGEETLVLVEPDTVPNDNAGGNVGDSPEPGASASGSSAPPGAGKRRR